MKQGHKPTKTQQSFINVIQALNISKDPAVALRAAKQCIQILKGCKQLTLQQTPKKKSLKAQFASSKDTSEESEEGVQEQIELE